MGGAERLWWLLRHFGHDECAVLLGGIEGWGGELRAGDEEIEPTTFVPRERSGDTIGADEIARRLADALVVVDARPPTAGAASRTRSTRCPAGSPAPRTRRGTSRCPELPDGELAVYCGSGVTACVDPPPRLARRPRGRLYPGSWSEW